VRIGRTHQWTPNPADLGPVERQNTHTQPGTDSEYLIEWDVIWSSPANEREHRERLEQESCKELGQQHK